MDLKKHFTEERGMSETKAGDYIKAYHRLFSLFSSYAILKQGSNGRKGSYHELVMQFLLQLEAVNSEREAFLLLDKQLPAPNTLKQYVLEEMAVEMFGIKDLYIWPAEAY